ncbi:MAG: hypothetical protein H6Q70_4643 [Firmicutes bacterium]|nr:hypothetical protein [Bacillota bacterium]
MPHRIQVLCAQKNAGAIRFGITLSIPNNAVKPKDGQFKSSKALMNIENI